MPVRKCLIRRSASGLEVSYPPWCMDLPKDQRLDDPMAAETMFRAPQFRVHARFCSSVAAGCILAFEYTVYLPNLGFRSRQET